MSSWDRAEMCKYKLASSPSLISGWAPVIMTLRCIFNSVGAAVRPALPVNHHKPAQTLLFPAVASIENSGRFISAEDISAGFKVCNGGMLGKEVKRGI